jgi:SAM-dependent methyltransferase
MTTRERRVVFGEVADDYDRIRPDYPAQMVDDALAAAGDGPVLEVGAGTGKATAPFAARGADLTCIEPDARMAEVLRRKLPGVRILVTSFEDWTPDRGYGLLICGQAWHWIDTGRRAGLAWSALAPGGLFAPFWNHGEVTDPALHAALREADDRHGITDHTPHRPLAGDGFFDERTPEAEFAELGLTEDRFTDFRIRRYEWSRSLPADDYRTFLRSFSLYRILDPAEADAAIDDVVATIERHGGRIDFTMVTDLAEARRI